MVKNSATAAFYGRYSSDNQRAASIEDQFRNCLKLAEVEGWLVPDRLKFFDAAISGSDSNRPCYQAMLIAANRNEFDILLVDDLSRLARDSVEQERAIRKLEFQGIRILAVSDGYDSQMKAAARKISRGIKGLMNEMRLDELREQVHRGLTGQAIKKRWCGGRPYGFKLKPILDSSQVDAYGQPARIGTVLEIDSFQANSVREIFSRFADGASCLTIARELNMRGVPSPGSSWKRKTRRCQGWVASAVRVILKNPLYTGLVRWNVSQFVRDPDTCKHKRRPRPLEEWIVNRDENLRIVGDDVYEQAQTRTRKLSSADGRLRSGGKAKYLFSGLLQCGCCGANYIMRNEREYACSSYVHGRACGNTIRVKRLQVENILFEPVRKALLDPERVQRMAKKIEAEYARLKAMQGHIGSDSRELEELNSRLNRLRERLKVGDPDLAPDELQAAVERVEGKISKLRISFPKIKERNQGVLLFPEAADIYNKQVMDGFGSNLAAAAKARVILRQMLGGQISLFPLRDGGLKAQMVLWPSIVLKVVGTSK